MRVDINKLLRDNPVSCKYGAPMGRQNRTGECTLGLYCQRVRFVDGDYSADGTYWGGGYGSPLWAIFSPDLETLIFVRAPTRAHAIEKANDETDRNLFFTRDEARPVDA
jgi:hypothetical protein